jgi:hypothetical protein
MNSRGPVDKDGGRNGRPAYRSSFSNTELSTVDLKWGMLFDGDLNPTPRLGQFLRGLGNHIVSFSLLYYQTNFKKWPSPCHFKSYISIALSVLKLDYVHVERNHVPRPCNGWVNWKIFLRCIFALSVMYMVFRNKSSLTS